MVNRLFNTSTQRSDYSNHSLRPVLQKTHDTGKSHCRLRSKVIVVKHQLNQGVRMRRLILFLGLTLLASAALAVPQVVQVGRYETLRAVPSAPQKDPLLAIGCFHFGVNVKTVGQALAQVLRPTGFSLINASHLPSVAQQVLKKPLPYTQRHLGPLAIKDALRILMGEDVFTLVVDPVHRLVSFRVKSRFLSHHTRQRRHRS